MSSSSSQSSLFTTAKGLYDGINHLYQSEFQTPALNDSNVDEIIFDEVADHQKSFLRTGASSQSQLVVKQILPTSPSLGTPIDLVSIRAFLVALEAYEALLPADYTANPVLLLSPEQLLEIAALNDLDVNITLKDMRSWTAVHFKSLLLTSFTAHDASDLLFRYQQIPPCQVSPLTLHAYLRFATDWNWVTKQGGTHGIDFQQLKMSFINGLSDRDLKLKVTASPVSNMNELLSVTQAKVRSLVKADKERVTHSNSLVGDGYLAAAIYSHVSSSACPQADSPGCNTFCANCGKSKHFPKECSAPCRMKGCDGSHIRRAHIFPPSQYVNSSCLQPSSPIILSSPLTENQLNVVTGFRASAVTVSSSVRSNVIMSDSCASHIFINTLLHFDSPPTFLTSPPLVKVANGAEEPILAVGKYRNMPAYFVPTLVCSLVSISVLTDHFYVVVFKKDMMIAFLPVDEHAVECQHILEQLSQYTNSASIFALKHSGLYTIPSSSAPSNLPVLTRPESNFSSSASLFPLQPSAAMTYYRDGSPAKLELSELVRYWHEALGHPTLEKMVDVVRFQTYQNLPSRLTTSVIRKYFPTCQACARGNLHRSALPQQSLATQAWLPNHRERRFEIDIKGPYTDSCGKPCLTYSGSMFTLNAVDTATGMEFTWLLQHKRHLVHYIKKLELLCIRYGYSLSCICTDDDFLTSDIRDHCATSSPIIDLQGVVPYEHGQLGRAERVQQTNEEAIWKSLAGAPHLEQKCWGLAHLHNVFTYNNLPQKRLGDKSPMFLFTGHIYDLLTTIMLPFGALVETMIPLADQTFATTRSLPASYVGPALGYKGAIRALNAATERILIRRTFRNIGPTTPPPLSANVIVTNEPLSSPDDLAGLPPPELQSREYDDSLALPPADLAFRRIVPEGPQVENISTLPIPSSSSTRHSPTPIGVAPDVDLAIPIESDGFVPVTSKKTRPKQHTIRNATLVLKQQLRTSAQPPQPSSITGVTPTPAVLLALPIGQPVQSESSPPLLLAPVVSTKRSRRTVPTSSHKRSSHIKPSRSTPDPYRRIYTHVRSSPYTANFTCSSASSTSYNPLNQRMPRTHAQAMLRPDAERWQEAERNEFNSFRENDLLHVLSHDFDISTIPKHLIYDLTVLYDIKTTPQGTIDKYKVRAALRGDKYVNENAAPLYAATANTDSVFLLLAIAAEQDMEMESSDIKTAFLIPPIDEEIYIRRPPGFTDQHMPKFSRLNKCMYGHPKASQYFRDNSDETLRSIGFVPLLSDDCVYRKDSAQGTIYVSVHVDDFGYFATKGSTLIKDTKQALSLKYNLKDYPNMESYLGMQITRDRDKRAIFISQPGYVTDMLEKYSVDSSFAPSIPLPVDYLLDVTKIKPSDALPLAKSEQLSYMSKVGSINYLATRTRPDILYASSCLSRVLQDPRIYHMKMVDQLLSFIAATRNLGLTLHSGEGIVPIVKVDCSFASHPDCKSHTGVTVSLGHHGASIMTISKKHTITADSSTVSEYIGCHTAAKAILWVRTFFKELGFPLSEPTVLYEDNKSTIALINKHCSGNRTRHVDIKYHMINELVRNKVILMQYLATTSMTADMLTKNLPPHLFTPFQRQILGYVI